MPRTTDPGQHEVDHRQLNPTEPPFIGRFLWIVGVLGVQEKGVSPVKSH